MWSKRERVALGVVLLLVLLSFADVLFLGKCFYLRDLARNFYPERKVLRDVFLAGELPFWNPHFGGGQPLAANPRWEVFYPPQWIVLLPDFVRAVGAEIVLHLLIAASGMFALLRALRLRWEAAAFGAFTFAFSGVMLSLISLLSAFYATAWLPWLGFALHRLVERRRAADFALAALSLGTTLLIGEPGAILIAGALAAAYAICRLRARGAALAAALCGAALLVGAAQVIPALDLQRDTARASALTPAEAAVWTMAPSRPLELLIPSAFGHFSADAIYYWGATNDTTHVPWLLSWYAGLFAATLIVAGFIHRISGWAFTAAIGAAGYLFSITTLLYRVGLHSIRYPERFFIPAVFVLIVFASIAASRFLEDARFRRTTLLVAVAFAALAALWLAFAWSPLFPRAFDLHGYMADTLREARAGALTALAGAIALALILTFRESPRAALPLLAIFVLTDLGARTRGLAPRIDRDFYDPPAVASALPHGARLYNDAEWQLMYVPQPRIAYDDRWKRMHNAMLPELQSVWGFDSVLEIDVAKTMLLPTAELTRELLRAQFSGNGAMVRRIVEAAGATHVVVLRDASSPWHPVDVVPLPGNSPFRLQGRGRLLGVRQTTNTIELDVEAAGPARAVVAVTRHRYWRATIDGAPATIQPANIAFQALLVPPGRHHIVMHYRNPLVIACAIVSLVSVLALAAVALRSKGSPPPSPR